MWNLWISTIFVCISCIACQSTGYFCNGRYNVPEWLSPSHTPPPGQVYMGLVPNYEGAMVQVMERKDNVTLSLFALPYAESQTDCLPARSVYHKLRKYWKNYTLIAGEDEGGRKYFANVFSGCYYIELADSTNAKWIWGGLFFNTTYHYYDTKLDCESNFEAASADQQAHIPEFLTPGQFTYDLRVGLTCLQLRYKLFEVAEINNNTLSDLDNGHIQPSEECRITYEKYGSPPRMECISGPGQSLKLVTSQVKAYGREGWSTVVKWTNLKTDDTIYFTKFERYNYSCEMSDSDLMTWDSVVSVAGRIDALLYELSR